MLQLWGQLHSLFDTDDGSLPDIFVDNLTSDQIVQVYRWVRSQSNIYSAVREPTLWHCEQKRDVSIRSLDAPAQMVIDDRAEQFRHGLTDLSIRGICIPPLTVAVSKFGIEFDYRMGDDWGASQVGALFAFLWEIQLLAPDANFSHSYEGAGQRTEAFEMAWLDFKREKSVT